MVASLSILEMNGLLDKLKSISMKELKEYMNKYICEGLEVGKKYNYGGKNSIHKVLKKNIEYGIADLCEKYEMNWKELYNILQINTWVISFYGEYEGISVWENIGRYVLSTQQRKNASISNDSFTLVDKPYFEYYNIEDENISIYDYIIYLFEERKSKMIGNYESEIASLKRALKDKEYQLDMCKKVDFKKI